MLVSTGDFSVEHLASCACAETAAIRCADGSFCHRSHGRSNWGLRRASQGTRANAAEDVAVNAAAGVAALGKWCSERQAEYESLQAAHKECKNERDGLKKELAEQRAHAAAAINSLDAERQAHLTRQAEADGMRAALSTSERECHQLAAELATMVKKVEKLQAAAAEASQEESRKALSCCC
eukprot:5825939-Pleurochrysis_carterae.AAC.1